MEESAVIEGLKIRILRLEASDALRGTLIRDVLHRFSLSEEEYYSSGGFSLLEVIDHLKERKETLEAKMERALIAVAHFTHRYNEDLERIRELRKWIETIELQFPQTRMFTQQARMSDNRRSPEYAPRLGQEPPAGGSPQAE